MIYNMICVDTSRADKGESLACPSRHHVYGTVCVLYVSDIVRVVYVVYGYMCFLCVLCALCVYFMCVLCALCMCDVGPSCVAWGVGAPPE